MTLNDCDVTMVMGGETDEKKIYQYLDDGN
jgi:hypothetical protein